MWFKYYIVKVIIMSSRSKTNRERVGKEENGKEKENVVWLNNET
jgi:hypothetical protein